MLDVTVLGVGAGYFVAKDDGQTCPKMWAIRVMWSNHTVSFAWTIYRPATELLPFLEAYCHERTISVPEVDLPR
jgi:hypothetical protein